MKIKPLDRRTFLRGFGTALALPYLEAMMPTYAAAATESSPLRFMALYFSHGTVLGERGEAGNRWNCSPNPFKLSEILRPLDPVKEELLIIHGIHNHAIDVCNKEGGGLGTSHWCEATSFLTGLSQKVYSTDTDRNKSLVALHDPGRSIDNAIADEVSKLKQFKIRNLTMGAYDHSGGGVASGRRGSIPIRTNISWLSETEQARRLTDSRAVYNKLFAGGASPAEDKAAVEQRLSLRKSVLDYVTEDARRLEKRLGTGDRNRLQEYFSSIESLEAQIRSEDESLRAPAGSVACQNVPASSGFGGENEARPKKIQNMIDLAVIAFRCDLTRVATMMLDCAHYENSISEKVPGNNRGHHNASHYATFNGLKETLALAKYHSGVFKYLIEKLGAINDPNGKSVLYNSLILYGSGLGDSDSHSPGNIPFILAGQAGGQLRTGRVVDVKGNYYLGDMLAYIGRLWGLSTPTWGFTKKQVSSI